MMPSVIFRRLLPALTLLLALPAQSEDAPTKPSADAPRFFLYASPTARRQLQQEGVDLKANVNRWRDLLRDLGERYEIVTNPERLLKLPARGTLVLPSAVALSPRERQIIGERLHNGDHLIATGVPDLDDAGGLPVARADSAAAGEDTRQTPFLVTAGDTPLTHALPAGSRLWTDEKARARMARIDGRAAQPDAYLSAWSRLGSDGALAHLGVAGSRRVLLGWQENMWDSQPAEFTQLARMAATWTSDRPVAYVATWPWPYRAAMTFGVDATWRFENMDAIAALLGKHHWHASFNLLDNDLKTQAARVGQLQAEGHDIGSLGDRWAVFGGTPEAEQAHRIGGSGHGLRPPEGRTDAATEKASRQLPYLVDAGRIDTLLPLPPGDERPVMLPNPVNLDGKAGLAASTETLRQQAALLRRLGGYAYVGIDASAAGPGTALRQALSSFLDEQAAQHVLWIADAARVADWRRDSQRVAVVDQAVRQGRIEVQVRVTDGSPLPEGMVLIVHAPAGRQLQGEDGKPADSRALPLSGLPPGPHALQVGLAP